MSYKIHEAAAMAGVTVRTLHHYDRIGLLRPRTDPANGYRLYGKAELERLRQILFFRELGFSLGEIRAFLEHPDFDGRAALENQRRLLWAQRERLDGLIRLIDDLMKGETDMNFEVFDRSAIEAQKEKYREEALRHWGDTDAWKESQARTAKYGDDDWRRAAGGLEDLMAQFAALRDGDPADAPAQELVAAWQQHITDHFYTCTREILAGLGQMYTADPRFTESIDAHGAGTAAFIGRAIEAYCKNR